MKKSLFILATPFLALPLIGCNRAVSPKEINVYGLSGIMSNGKYIFIADFPEEGNINRRVSWSVDKPEVASINSYGILTTSKVNKNTDITVTVTSRVDKTIKDSMTVTVYPAEETSKEDFLDMCLTEEKKLAQTLKPIGEYKEIPATIEEDDYIIGFNRKFVADTESAKFSYMNNGEDRIEGSSNAYFKDTKEGKSTRIFKSFEYDHKEFIEKKFETFESIEEKGLGAYNCFAFDSDGNDTKDTYGYYLCLYGSIAEKSSLRYRVFKDGYMITAIDAYNDRITSYAHFGLK